MKTLVVTIAASMLIPFLGAGQAEAKPLQSRPAEREKPCIEKGDANACFALGYEFMRAKGANSKKLARYYFREGCKAKMGKTSCSATEAKLAARDFTQDRAIASPKPATKMNPSRR